MDLLCPFYFYFGREKNGGGDLLICLPAPPASLPQVSGRPQEEGGQEGRQGLDSLLQSAGSFLDKNKGDITSLLGIAGEAEGEHDSNFLTRILKVGGIDQKGIFCYKNFLSFFL